MTMEDEGIETGVVLPEGSRPESQPRWRRDFPVDSSDDDYVARRDLVKFIVLTSLAFTVGQFWLLSKRWLSRPPQPLPSLPVARVDDIPIGGSRTFRYPHEDSPPRLLIRTGESAFVAYNQQCTHLMCPVVARVEEGILHCPCHEGVFDLKTGRPIAGPPRRPLARIDLKILNGEVYATGIEGGAA